MVLAPVSGIPSGMWEGYPGIDGASSPEVGDPLAVENPCTGDVVLPQTEAVSEEKDPLLAVSPDDMIAWQ